jgi:Ca2+-transporting ATPase
LVLTEGIWLQPTRSLLRGRGIATVTATGADSTIGRMAALLDTGPEITPLQRWL